MPGQSTVRFINHEPPPSVAPREFEWTKEELLDAARVAAERLYEGSTELDEFLPRSAHLDRIQARTEAERRKRAIKEAEQELTAYETRHGAAPSRRVRV